MTKKLNILLADDDTDDCFFFKKALSSLSVETELSIVEDGEKLMTYLSSRTKLPDVLFLDINMPKKNGSECLLEIKSNAKMKGFPVIIYSTSLHDDVADLLYKNGAHYYIQKTDFTELPEILNKAIELIREAGPPPARDKFILSHKKYA